MSSSSTVASPSSLQLPAKQPKCCVYKINDDEDGLDELGAATPVFGEQEPVGSVVFSMTIRNLDISMMQSNLFAKLESLIADSVAATASNGVGANHVETTLSAVSSPMGVATIVRVAPPGNLKLSDIQTSLTDAMAAFTQGLESRLGEHDEMRQHCCSALAITDVSTISVSADTGRRSSTDENRRLSFMYEHNSLINVRIASLTKDIRGALQIGESPQARRKSSIYVEENAAMQKTPSNPSSPSDSRLLGRPRSKSMDPKFAASSLAHSPATKQGLQLSPTEEQPATQHSVELTPMEEQQETPTMFSFSPATRAACGDEAAQLEQGKVIEELRAKLDEESQQRLQVESERDKLKDHLLRCEAVIARLSTEIDFLTMKQSAAAEGDGNKENELKGAINELNNTFERFFGKYRDKASITKMVEAQNQSDDEIEPLTWAVDPLSRNVRISRDLQTAMFVGDKNKEPPDLHGFVVTAEPPMVEGGYTFEVIVKRVQQNHDDGIAIGFTATPPRKWPKDLPATADGLDRSWLIGYSGSGEMCVDGRWKVVEAFSPSQLAVGDYLGVEVSVDGLFAVFLNGRRVYERRIWATIEDCPPQLYGIVDLLGNTDAVYLVE